MSKKKIFNRYFAGAYINNYSIVYFLCHIIHRLQVPILRKYMDYLDALRFFSSYNGEIAFVDA